MRDRASLRGLSGKSARRANPSHRRMRMGHRDFDWSIRIAGESFKRNQFGSRPSVLNVFRIERHTYCFQLVSISTEIVSAPKRAGAIFFDLVLEFSDV